MIQGIEDDLEIVEEYRTFKRIGELRRGVNGMNLKSNQYNRLYR